MTDLERAVQAVENGLRTAVAIQGRPQRPLSLRQRMDYYRVPGFSIALIEQAELAWAQGYGVLEAGGTAEVTPTRLFQAASISKPATAMVALHLVESGVLSLDSDVNDALRSWHVPENEHTRESKVTLRGLLSHTAGLSVSGYSGYPAGAALPSLPQILDGIPPAIPDPVRVMQPPASAYAYSGGGYVLAQLLMEDVTGRSLAELAQEFIFAPLGMRNSTFELPLPQAYHAQATAAHGESGAPIPGKWHSYPEGAAAGLWSTPSDLARLICEVLRSQRGESQRGEPPRVLSAAMTRQMLTPQVGWVGLGFPILETDGQVRFEHSGANEGYRCLMAGYPATRRGIVWMTNGEYGHLLGREVMRALQDVFGVPGYAPVEKSIAQIDEALLARVAGVYCYLDDPEHIAEVSLEGGSLYLKESPGGLPFQLYPASECEFFCLEHAASVAFSQNASGEIDGMKIGSYAQLERVQAG